MRNKSIPAKKRQKAPQTFSNLFADAVSVLLLSLGLFTAYLSITYWEVSGYVCVGLVLFSLLLLLFLRLRWWVTPGVLAAGALLFFLLYRTRGEREQLYLYWSSFLDWLLHLAPYSDYFRKTGGEAFLQFLLAFGITALLFVLVRRFFSFLLLAAMQTAFYVLLLCFQDTDLSGPLLLTVAGMLILLPRPYSRHRIKKEKAVQPNISRGKMQIIAIPIALLIVTLCQLFVPGDTGAWKSKQLNLLAEDLSVRLGNPFASASGYHPNFSLQSYGYNQENGRMGGPVNLRDEVVLQVDAERAVLLRGRVYDKYTGYSWMAGEPDGDFRYHGIFMEGFRDLAFPKPAVYPSAEANERYRALTEEMAVGIRYRKSTLSTVFTVGNMPDGVLEDRELNREIYFNRRGEMYLHKKIPLQTILQLKGDVWRWWDAGFYTDFLRLEQDGLAQADENMAQIAQRYTALPEAVPAPVTELTAQITAGLKTPYEKAHAIERWIAENCTYTLTPDVPPEDEDFVAHFLETRRGYCVYYATAMAVMARQAGIPARYVTGFALERTPDTFGNETRAYAYNATGTTAHAWAELYFQGIGWVDFDPTRGSSGDSLVWQSADPQEAAADVAPTPMPLPTPTPMPSETSEIENAEATKTAPKISPLTVAMGVAAAFLVLYVAYRILRQRKMYSYGIKRMRAGRGNTTAQYNRYFTDLLKLLKLLQMESWPGETLTDFAKRVDLRLPVEGCAFVKIAQIQMRAQFGELPPTHGDVEKISKYHRLLETMLMKRLGKLKYFFLRALR